MSFSKLRDKWLGEVGDDILSTLMHIEINPVELCNRRCTFCPRFNSELYPNTDNRITHETIHSLCKSLRDINYTNVLEICGFGEPLLHNDLIGIVRTINSYDLNLNKFNIITNGDLLTAGIANALVESGVDNIIVNLYDGEHQVKKIESIFGFLESNKFIIRHSYKKGSLTLNNRSGYINVGEDRLGGECYLPFYKMVIDWNGDMLLCAQDWGRQGDLKLNINTHSISDMWLSDSIAQYRLKLLQGDRSLRPCSKCNVIGTLRGKECFDKFKHAIQ